MCAKIVDGADVTSTEIVSVPLHHLNKVVEGINKQIKDKSTPISFEFIIASLFPSAMDNIKDFGTKKFIEGYNSRNEE